MPLFGKRKPKEPNGEKKKSTDRSKPSSSSSSSQQQQQQRRSTAAQSGRSGRPATNGTSSEKSGTNKSRKKPVASANTSSKGSRPRPSASATSNPPPEQQPQQLQQQQQQQEYSFHHQQQQQQARPAPVVAPRPPQEQHIYNPSGDPNIMSTPTQIDGYSSSAGSNLNPTTTVVQNITVGNESLATIEITRELVKQFIADIWNRGEIELIPHVCHPSLRFNGHVGMDRVGHEGFARMVTTVREALTDYHCEIHSMVVETNKAFCRLRFTGKHTGNLLGYPPTGKTVAWMGASEFTCKNGKILKVWELGDVKSLEEQLRSAD